MSRLKNLGLNIKKYREKKKLTQVNLAIKLGLSQEYICRVEKGQKFMSLKKLFELADILEVSVKNLFNFE
ncbi:MAG: helix-turn-helix domain-containing protein [Candidatus Gastranaerophilales bacterium]|nr:helix-turn-helix domain-containing protein [Candidatus Gastranaerophilales bacterium]